VIATLTKRFFEKLARKGYRDAYVSENIAMLLSHQIRALREQRGWSQRKFAEELGSHASVVNRYEDPEYGKLTVKTLLDIAKAFDVGLIIRFVSFPRLIAQTRDVSPEALQVESFNEEQFAVYYPREKSVGVTFLAPNKPTAGVTLRTTKTSGGHYKLPGLTSATVATRAVANG
jgi:transcriptional regulator with XRE-family HTH domain